MGNQINSTINREYFNYVLQTKNEMEVQQSHQSHIVKPFDGFSKIVTLYDGRTMPLAQYRRQIQQSSIESQSCQQQAETTSNQSAHINKSQQQQYKATVNQSSQINEPRTKILAILVAYPNGVKKSVKFSAPVKTVVSATDVKNILNRIGVPGTGQSIKVKCMACPTNNYNFLVDVENIQQQSFGQALVLNESNSKGKLSGSTNKRSGFLAICPNCGVCSDDHFQCVRCRAVFDENVLYIPSAN